MRKRYVIYENTIKEIIRIADEKCDENSHSYELYNYEPDRTNLSEEQKRIQYQNSWQTKINMDLIFYNYGLEQEIEEAVFDVILSKSREDVYKTIYDRIMNSKMRACVDFVDTQKGFRHVQREIEMDFTPKHPEVEYVRDNKELEKIIEDVKIGPAFSTPGNENFVYIDKVSVMVYDYRTQRMAQDIPKLIKKMMKKHLTYCLKNGKSIVPDEYLDKGKTGIQEWQELKRSSNKNNSMEKRMLKQILRDKKTFAADCIYTATRAITAANQSWSIPSLEVEGRFNKSRVQKLVTNQFKDKTDVEIMNMSDEEILDMFKEYWKGVLMDAYKAVDACKVEEKNGR